MQETPHQNGRRIRNVPIHIEGRPSREDSSRHYTGSRPGHGPGNETKPDECERERGASEPLGRWSSRAPAHANEPYGYGQRTSPHTSSININYKPHSTTPEQKCNDQVPPRRTVYSSRLSAQQTDKCEPDKENSESAQPHESSNDGSMNRKLNSNNNNKSRAERNPSPIPPVIPLPPPPSPTPAPSPVSTPGQAKAEKDQTSGPGQTKQQGDQKETSKTGEAKQETGPMAVIASTKAEVLRLLQEVAKCDETSTKSKEFLRLEELLTLCILKLDGIDAPELRQQRKEVINMINKCTDILERRINLNSDIQQLAASCQ